MVREDTNQGLGKIFRLCIQIFYINITVDVKLFFDSGLVNLYSIF